MILRFFMGRFALYVLKTTLSIKTLKAREATTPLKKKIQKN